MRLMRKRSVDSPLASDGTSGWEIDARPLPQTDSHQEDSQRTKPTDIPKVDSIIAETEEDKEREKRMSMMTDVDISAELATIQTAEKFTLTSAVVAVGHQASPNPDEVMRPRSSIELLSTHVNNGLSLDTNPGVARPRSPDEFLPRPQMANSLSLETSFDLASSLGLGAGLRDSVNSVKLGDMRSALDRLMDDVKGTASASSSSTKPTMRVDPVMEGIKAGQFDNSFDAGDESIRTETETDVDASMSMSMSMSVDNHVARPRAAPLQRAATDSLVYTAPAFSSPVHAEEHAESKNAIREREDLILQKRRAARRREDDESLGYYTPPRTILLDRPSRQRSQSTGDAGLGSMSKSDMLLDIGFSDDEGDPLADSISKELRKLDPESRKGVSAFVF